MTLSEKNSTHVYSRCSFWHLPVIKNIKGEFFSCGLVLQYQSGLNSLACHCFHSSSNSHIVLLLGQTFHFPPLADGLDSEVPYGGFFENQPGSILSGLFSQSFCHKTDINPDQPGLIFVLTNILFMHIQVLIELIIVDCCFFLLCSHATENQIGKMCRRGQWWG